MKRKPILLKSIESENTQKNNEYLNNNAEKDILKKDTIENIDNKIITSNQVISIISCCSAGKSFLSKILANRFRKTNDVCLLTVKGIPYYNFEEDYFNYMNEQCQGNLSDFLDVNYTDKLSIGLIDYNNITAIVDKARIKKDIVLIEGDFNKDILKCSNKVIFLFDNNYNNMRSNLRKIKEFTNYINLNKCIAVINNAFTDSKSYKFIYSELNNFGFSSIITIRSYGPLVNDYIFEDETDISDYNNSINDDINKLIYCLNGTLKSNKSFFYHLHQLNRTVDSIIDKIFNLVIKFLNIFRSKLMIILLIILTIFLFKKYDIFTKAFTWINNNIDSAIN